MSNAYYILSKNNNLYTYYPIINITRQIKKKYNISNLYSIPEIKWS